MDALAPARKDGRGTPLSSRVPHVETCTLGLLLTHSGMENVGAASVYAGHGRQSADGPKEQWI